MFLSYYLLCRKNFIVNCRESETYDNLQAEKIFLLCQSNGGNSLTEQNTESAVSIPADWVAGFQAGPQQKGDSLYVTEFLNLEHREPEEMPRHYPPVCRVSGECFYALQRYDTKQGQKVFLEIHSLGKASPEQSIELDMAEWQLPDASIKSFDLTEDGYVFLVKTESAIDTDSAELSGTCRIVYTDLQGVFVSQTDLTDRLETQELFQTAWENQVDLYRDQEGFLYLIMDQYSVLLVLDQDENIVTQYNCGTSGDNEIEEPVRDNSGRLIFPVSLGEERITRFLGRMEKELKELAVFQELINGNGSACMTAVCIMWKKRVLLPPLSDGTWGQAFVRVYWIWHYWELLDPMISACF